MTSDEKHTQREQRNSEICAYYLAGNKLAACASKFRLGRQRTLQVLQGAGVWKPFVRSKRTQFLGVSISEETKDALRKKATEQGTSVSRLASDALDEVVR